MVSSQYTDFGNEESSNYYQGGALNTQELYGSSYSQPIQYEEGGYFNDEPTQTPLTRTGALTEENIEEVDGSSSSEDIDDESYDEDKSSEEDNDEVTDTVMVHGENHIPRASWFQNEKYKAVY